MAQTQDVVASFARLTHAEGSRPTTIKNRILGVSAELNMGRGESPRHPLIPSSHQSPGTPGALVLLCPRAVPEQMYGIKLSFPWRAGSSHCHAPYTRVKTALVSSCPLPLWLP